MKFDWNEDKNKWLHKERQINFDTAIEVVLQEGYIYLGPNPSRANQLIMLFEYQNYVYVCPCVFDGETVFLKTIYPSRKYTKQYLYE